MENMFVWMLVFAGATIGLLGTFLVASERELKKKRAEVEVLLAGVNTAQTAYDEPHPLQPTETAPATELIAKNKELADEVASLSSRLQLSETTGKALSEIQNELQSSQLENAELRKSNQKLEEELAQAKSQLDFGRAQLEQSRNEDQRVTTQHAQFETEIATLRDELELSRRKILALETEQAQRSDFESRESLMKEQQQQLKGQIAELNNQLVDSRNSLQELEATRAQLQESETLRRQVMEDNQRLQQQISAWQERLADSDEQRWRLTTLSHHIEALKAKRAAANESQRQLEEELDALARIVDPSERIYHAASPLIHLETVSTGNGQDHLSTDLNPTAAAVDASIPINAAAVSPAPVTVKTAAAKKRRFGIFSAIFALTLSGSVVAGFWR